MPYAQFQPMPLAEYGHSMPLFGQAAPPPVPAGPVFRFECPIGCDPIAAAQCRAALRRSIVAGINLATNAAGKLEASPRDADTIRHFTFLFGHPPTRPVSWAGNRQSGAIVARRFRMVEAALRRRGTLYRCDACAGKTANAFTRRTTDPNVIFLCPRFWRRTPVIRGGIILHEMLHLLFPFFRHFHNPPHPDDPQERRRDNAHCFEAFAMLVGGHTPDQTDINRCRARPA